MENKKIIIILVAIIVVLAAVLGVMFLQSTTAKEPTKVKIISNKTQYEGGELSIKLTDLKGTAISKEIVNVTITNSKGKVVVDDVVKTNSKGKAKLDLDLKKGKYNVNVSYDGNENYTGNNTTQKLTIEEVVVDDVVKTNSKGKAKLDLDLKKGKYTVNVTYSGNENYTGNNTTQKLTIKEEVVEVDVVKEHYESNGSPVPGVSESDYNEVLRSSHGDADLAQKRAEAYHRDGVF